MGYYLEAIALKVYHIQYPTFCTIDVVSLATLKTDKMISCGFKGNKVRVQPLHGRDPNIDLSLLRYLAPQF